MSLNERLEKLEGLTKPQGAIRIRVLRIPGDVPEEEQATWARAHPSSVSKVVEMDGHETRITRYH